MGSNQNKKYLVRMHKLCYICEQNAPQMIDEVQGHICFTCHNDIQAMLLHYALNGGYQTRRGGTAYDHAYNRIRPKRADDRQA